MHVNLIVSVALEVYTGMFTNFESCTLRLFCQLFFRTVLWRTCELFSLNNLPTDPTDLFQSLRALLLDILLTFSTAFWLAFSNYFACYLYGFIPKISSCFLGYFCLQFPQICFMNWLQYTDKKENQIFLIYKEIQNGAVAKSYMRKGFNEEMRKYFLIYEEAISHIWLCNCSILNFLIYEENLIFFFISVFCLLFLQIKNV